MGHHAYCSPGRCRQAGRLEKGRGSVVRGRQINGKVPEPLLRRKTGVVHPIGRCSLKSFNWEPALKAPEVAWGVVCFVICGFSEEDENVARPEDSS